MTAAQIKKRTKGKLQQVLLKINDSMKLQTLMAKSWTHLEVDKFIETYNIPEQNQKKMTKYEQIYHE